MARTMAAMAIAIALVACKQDEPPKPQDDCCGPGRPLAPGEGSGSDNGEPANMATMPGNLPASSHAVPLEASLDVFVAIRANGALAIGAIPVDRAGAWPVPTYAPSLPALVAIGERLREGLDAGTLDGIVLAEAGVSVSALIEVLATPRFERFAVGVRDARGAIARAGVGYGTAVDAPGDEVSELVVGPGADPAAIATTYTASKHAVAVLTLAAGVTVQGLVEVTDALLDAGCQGLILRKSTSP